MGNLGKIIKERFCYVSSEPDGKKYVLLDADRWFDTTFTGMDFVSMFRGTGHSEWEVQLGQWFVDAIATAKANGTTEADISAMFHHRLYAPRNRELWPEDVREHLIACLPEGQQSTRRFTKLSEKDGKVYLVAPATW